MENKVDFLQIPRLSEVPQYILDAHPILAYRVKNFTQGINVRGITDKDSTKCAIVLDDSVIGGEMHFPCVIYMREKGKAIGKVGPNMRMERKKWHDEHNTHKDPICKANCLDVCISYNNKYREFHPE